MSRKAVNHVAWAAQCRANLPRCVAAGEHTPPCVCALIRGHLGPCSMIPAPAPAPEPLVLAMRARRGGKLTEASARVFHFAHPCDEVTIATGPKAKRWTVTGKRMDADGQYLIQLSGGEGGNAVEVSAHRVKLVFALSGK